MTRIVGAVGDEVLNYTKRKQARSDSAGALHYHLQIDKQIEGCFWTG